MEEKESFEPIDEAELTRRMNAGRGGTMAGSHCDLHRSAGALAWMFLRELLDGPGKRTGISKGDRRRAGVSERDGAWSGQSHWKMRK